jgi:hypothetical protein
MGHLLHRQAEVDLIVNALGHTIEDRLADLRQDGDGLAGAARFMRRLEGGIDQRIERALIGIE